MNIDILATILLDADCFREAGTDLFLEHMPDDCTQGGMIKLPMAGIAIDHEIPGYLKGKFQVIVRSPAHTWGDAKAKEVMKALLIYDKSYADEQGNQMYIQRCYASFLPIVYPRSPGNTYEWSINLDMVYSMAL